MGEGGGGGMSGTSSTSVVTVAGGGGGVGEVVGGGGCYYRPPFTAVQWQELEHQAMIYKYLMAGLPVPAELVVPIRRSFEALSSRLFHHTACRFAFYLRFQHFCVFYYFRRFSECRFFLFSTCLVFLELLNFFVVESLIIYILSGGSRFHC